MKLHERVIAHIDYCARNCQSTFVGALVAPESVEPIHNGIIDLVAKMEGWPQPINYTFATFQTANQTLYFRFGILIEVFWRQPAPPDGEKYVELDTEKYTKLFFEWTPTQTGINDNF